MAVDELARESTISLGSSPTRSVFQDRFPEAWGFAQADAARDHSLINPFAEVLAYLRYNLLAKIRPTVEHCHDDAAHLETLVRARIAHLLDQSNNFYQTFEREILALYWSQKFVSGGERVAHEDPKRRRAIDKNQIKCVVRQQWLERFRQTGEMIRHPRDFHFSTGQIDFSGHDEQALASRGQDFLRD